MPVHMKNKKVSARNRFWIEWGWLAWVVPLVILIVRLMLGGWWEVLALWVWSPAIVVIFGLLGWLPRFILKKRGFTNAPAASSFVMMAHWTSLACAFLAIPPVTSGNARSFIGRAIPVMTPTWESWFFTFSVLAVASTAVINFLIAIFVVPSIAGVDTKARNHARGWLLVTCLATPILIFGAAGISELGKLYGPKDAAGNSQADTRGLTETEVRELHQERWQALQQKLIPLRERIAEGGWSPAGSRGPNSNPALDDEYRLDIVWHVAVPVDDPSATTEALYDHLAASGWIVDGEIPPPHSVTARSGIGGEVRVSVTPSVEDPTIVTITIRAVSPSYWAEATVVNWQPIDPDGTSTEKFRFDEWPPLRPAG